MENFELQIIAPDRMLLSEAVQMVEIPGAEGDFGVLALHAPYISALRPGVARIKKSESETLNFFVSGGFAEVANNRCIILADYATPLEEINRDAVLSRIEKIKNDLSLPGNDNYALRRELTTCEAMLAVTQ